VELIIMEAVNIEGIIEILSGIKFAILAHAMVLILIAIILTWKD